MRKHLPLFLEYLLAWFFIALTFAAIFGFMVFATSGDNHPLPPRQTIFNNQSLANTP